MRSTGRRQKHRLLCFEVMEERQVTVDGYTHIMQVPFIVLATQNPIEQEGTYRLPEAQLDRFLFKIEVGYPTLTEEISILTKQQGKTQGQMLEDVRKILSPVDIQHYRTQIQSVIIEPKLIEFIARIVNETRNNPALYLGASPRASLAILKIGQSQCSSKRKRLCNPRRYCGNGAACIAPPHYTYA